MGLVTGAVACSGRVEPTSVFIEDPVRHYYPIRFGDELWIAYDVTNTGENPLIISEIQTSMIPNGLFQRGTKNVCCLSMTVLKIWVMHGTRFDYTEILIPVV